jgi:hypothetical protein
MKRGGVLPVFSIGGAIFLVVGGLCVAFGGKIASITFFLIGGIWIIVSLGVGGLYKGMAHNLASEQQLFTTGTRATATLEKLETTGTVLNNVNIRVIMTLRVHGADGDFVVERKAFVPTFNVPQPGAVLNVAYDPADKTKVALELDTSSSTMGGLNIVTSATTGPQVGTVTAPAGGSSVDLLERLQALRSQGALTDAEFEAQKAKLLGP